MGAESKRKLELTVPTELCQPLQSPFALPTWVTGMCLLLFIAIGCRLQLPLLQGLNLFPALSAAQVVDMLIWKP